MSYYKATGAVAVDFSHGTCGPGMYKWHPNGTCQPLPGGLTAPEFGGSGAESPFSLPGGNVGFPRGIVDFSGGTCTPGWIKPGPTEPCKPIEPGMSMSFGDWEDYKVGIVSGAVAGMVAIVGATLILELLGKVRH